MRFTAPAWLRRVTHAARTPLEVAGAARRHLRNRALAICIAILALSNVMSNRVLPGWAYVPWNLSVAALLVWIGHRALVGPVAIGLAMRKWRRPVGVGLILVAVVAMTVLVLVTIPATRTVFFDVRAAHAPLSVMLYNVFIRIPLGTVVLEEVAFRGVLPGLLGAAPAWRWETPAVLWASTMFGLWHILPSFGIASGNAAVGGALHGNQLLATVLAVAGTAVIGVAICLVARIGRGIKATMLLHWATNSVGFLTAWLVSQ